MSRWRKKKDPRIQLPTQQVAAEVTPAAPAPEGAPTTGAPDDIVVVARGRSVPLPPAEDAGVAVANEETVEAGSASDGQLEAVSDGDIPPAEAITEPVAEAVAPGEQEAGATDAAPVDGVAEQVAEKTAEDADQGAAETPVEDPAVVATQQMAQEPAQQLIAEPGEEPGQEHTSEQASEPVPEQQSEQEPEQQSETVDPVGDEAEHDGSANNSQAEQVQTVMSEESVPEPDGSHGEAVSQTADPSDPAAVDPAAVDPAAAQMPAGTSEVAHGGAGEPHPEQPHDTFPADQVSSDTVPDTTQEVAQEVAQEVVQGAAGAPAGQPESTRALQEVGTPMGRFRKWLGGTTTVGRPLVHTPPAQDHQAAAPVAQPTVEQVMTPQLAKREIRTLKASQRSWDTLMADREAKATEARETVESNERKIAALSDWVTNFDRSYQWRVQQRMDQQLQRAQADLRAYEDSVNNAEEFEAGRLSELRRSFHGLIRQILFITVPIAILTVAIPLSFEIPKLDALETFYDPRLSAPIITLVVLGVIAAIFLFRRATGKDTVKNITIVKWIVFTVFVGLVIVALPTFEDDLRNVVSPYLEANQNRIFTVLGIIVLLWIVLALAVYYRGWSQYRRAIDTQLAKLQAVISGYVETQQEVNRLGLLYTQTSEWLRILAFSLYRPWVTPTEWEEEKHTESEFRDFPFALRVAQVDDQAGAKSAELERIIASKLLVQGWRANAFRDLVDEVRRDMGVAGGKFSVEALDKDLPHQTNNTRNLLKKYLEGAASGVGDEGTSEEAETGFLVEVARKHLLHLIEQTQSVALSAARPPVHQIISDPLDDLVNDVAVLQGQDDSENWDDFLKESLGTDEIIQPPLSILNFTPDGQMNKVGESPKTFVLIPQRLADALPGGVSDSVNLVPVTDNSSRAVEIIARVDVIGPVKPADIRLLSPADQRVSAMGRGSRDSGTKVSSLCQDCFDPTCPASLDSGAACSSAGL